MLKGTSTLENYEKCLKAGLCKDHLKELEVTDDSQSYELQRKALLYIRLQIFGPILFRRPYSSEKMKTLFSMSKYFLIENSTPQSEEDFKDRVLLLDAVVVYTICYFSKICCAGGLFRRSRTDEMDAAYHEDPKKKAFLLNLLTKKKLEEADISHFNPLLQENFQGYNKELIKVCYVAALLFVRNVATNVKLKQALEQQELSFANMKKEAIQWSEFGSESIKQERYDEAITSYTHALNYNPYSTLFLKGRVQAYYNLKKYKDAVLDCYVLLMIKPTSIYAFDKLASSFFYHLQYFDAKDVAEYGLERCKDFQNEDPENYKALTQIQSKISKKCSKQDQSELLHDMLKISQTVKENQLLQSMANSKVKKKNLPSSRFEPKFTDKKDVPELIEASDSETETQDVPDLMEASNTDDSDDETQPSNSILKFKSTQSFASISQERNTDEPAPKTKKLDLVNKEAETILQEDEKEKIKSLQSSLKEASQALLDGCGVLAVRRFRESLDDIKAFPQLYLYEECEIVCIKYACGLSYSKSGGYEDLQRALLIFKEIMEEHSSIIFPAVYYGIGLTCHKLNRFKDALQYIKIVDDILQKGINFKVYVWPGLTKVIDETKRDHLQNLILDMTKECENPPPPNATCRLEKCSSLQPAIYYSDPDFKGFYSIQCSEQCCLQYHPQCWKVIKTSKHCTDKEFLEQTCFTPDCEGIIIKIQNISKEGTEAKLFEVADTKKATKQKKTRLEKKLEVKEEKKRKRKDSSSKSESTSEVAEEIPNPSPPDQETENCSKEIDQELKMEMKEKSEKTSTSSFSQFSANAEPVLVLKKEKFVNENAVKIPAKMKEHKKAKTNTLSIDEFLQRPDIYGNEHQQRLQNLRQNNPGVYEESWMSNGVSIDPVGVTSSAHGLEGFQRLFLLPTPLTSNESNAVDDNYNAERGVQIDPTPALELPECNAKNPYSVDPVGVTSSAHGLEDFQPVLPTPFSSKVPNSVEESGYHGFNAENGIQTPTAPALELNDCITKNLYSYFKEILAKRGPIREDDPAVIKGLEKCTEANEIIADCGGIGKFLQKNLDFAFVNDTYICLVDDMSLAYKKSSSSALHLPTGNLNLFHFDSYELVAQKSYSALNPDAEEYMPARVSCTSSVDSVSEDYKSEMNRNSPVLISAISRLRQPLAVDTETDFKRKEANSVIMSAASGQESLEESDYSNCLGSTDNTSLRNQLAKESSPESIVTELTERCREGVLAYFSDSMKEHRSHIDTCLKPYAILELPKRVSKCIQTESVEKVSVGTMKTDEELQRVKEVACLLNEEKYSLVQQTLRLEEHCNSTMDSATKFQKKSSVELMNLKKELEETNATLKQQTKDFRSKESKMEKEMKLLSESLKKGKDDNLAQKNEMDKLLISNESMKSQMMQFEESAHLLQQENQVLKNELDMQQSKLKGCVKNVETARVHALERAKKAELLLLRLTKSEFLKRIDNKTAEAVLRMKELQDGSSLISANVNPVFIQNMESLLSQIQTYIAKLGKIRLEFMASIDEQINEVNNGTPLEALRALDIKDLPEIPSWKFEHLLANATPNGQPTTWTSQMMNSAFNAAPAYGVPPSQVGNFPMNPNVPQPQLSPVNLPQRLSSSESTKVGFREPPKQASDSMSGTRMPHVLQDPMLRSSNPTYSASAQSVANSQSTVTKPKQPDVNLKKQSPAVSTASLASTRSEKKSDSSLELAYNVDRSETPKPTPVAACSQPKPAIAEPKSSYEKLLYKLKCRFPQYSQSQLMDLVKAFRQRREKGLSGLSMENIINEVSAIIEAKIQRESWAAAPATRNEPAARSQPLQNRVLVNKKLVLDEAKTKEVEDNSRKKKCAWGVSSNGTSKTWSGNNSEESCVICFEDMTELTTYKVECGHCFHKECVREWLSKKSDCPICRVHLLLPEDFPALS